MLFALAFTFSAALAPHTELPSTFSSDRVFVMPRVANSTRRLALWVDSDGSGFLRKHLVDELQVQTVTMWAGGQPTPAAYLPPLGEREFPAVTGNHGALPLLNEEDVANDPIFNGIDGQLGWSWLGDRIWTIDYVGRHFYWDHTAPPYSSGARVGLTFDRAHRYPQLDMTIDGTAYKAALDTAATVALSEKTVTSLNDGLGAVRATSFIRRRTLDAWHAAHPDWTYIAQAGLSKGVSLIRVPQVHAGRVTFRDVWFSTRPNDDVFEGETVDAKLGPTAFSKCAVTIDYVHDAAAFECVGD
jgi:hypothetical protein